MYRISWISPVSVLNSRTNGFSFDLCAMWHIPWQMIQIMWHGFVSGSRCLGVTRQRLSQNWLSTTLTSNIYKNYKCALLLQKCDIGDLKLDPRLYFKDVWFHRFDVCENVFSFHSELLSKSKRVCEANRKMGRCLGWWEGCGDIHSLFLVSLWHTQRLPTQKRPQWLVSPFILTITTSIRNYLY